MAAPTKEYIANFISWPRVNRIGELYWSVGMTRFFPVVVDDPPAEQAIEFRERYRRLAKSGWNAMLIVTGESDATAMCLWHWTNIEKRTSYKLPADDTDVKQKI